jgi:hypothetical protein
MVMGADDNSKYNIAVCDERAKHHQLSVDVKFCYETRVGLVTRD